MFSNQFFFLDCRCGMDYLNVLLIYCAIYFLLSQLEYVEQVRLALSSLSDPQNERRAVVCDKSFADCGGFILLKPGVSSFNHRGRLLQ